MNRPWDLFFREKVSKIFTDKRVIIDIGGGLRIIREKGNKYDSKREWIRPLLKNVDYKVMDPVATFNPDIVGDIHKMPFADNSLEAIICLAVLEHVENPIRACQEIYRVLQVGGYCFVYVPFLYYYHAEKGYYGDYWRFSRDTINYLFKGFKTIEIESVRGAIETLLRLTPLGRSSILALICYYLDRITGKLKSNQVSGYYIFLIK